MKWYALIRKVLPSSFAVLSAWDRKVLPSSFVSALETRRLMQKGCVGFLGYVIDLNREEVRLEDVRVVREFEDVFPEDLPGLPPEREIEFAIEVIPGTAPISHPPYRLAPAELQELRTHQEAQDTPRVVTGTLFLCDIEARVLFDFGATQSYRDCLRTWCTGIS
ncbi:hypothetical protein LIER_24520 [Lithospermum erythrorhizon]|uniref:Uncharacterized protein n=1 Tax=Lithospermum erythrorhizon TaxID=34254 RepID=A0AAV3R544_LITER